MNIKVLFAIIIYTKHNIQCKNCNINYKNKQTFKSEAIKTRLYDLSFFIQQAMYTNGSYHVHIILFH